VPIYGQRRNNRLCGGITGEYGAEPEPGCSTKTGNLHREIRGLKELVHRPGGVFAHILEDVGVSSEGHRRAGVSEHPGYRMERDALPQG
jgi:hypothetical protein